jgi:hypothetical protein
MGVRPTRLPRIFSSDSRHRRAERGLKGLDFTPGPVSTLEKGRRNPSPGWRGVGVRSIGFSETI